MAENTVRLRELVKLVCASSPFAYYRRDMIYACRARFLFMFICPARPSLSRAH